MERITGERFEDYVAHRIFAPLGMASSTFEQPPPPALLDRLSRASRTSSSPPLPYFEVIPAPAGELITTAADMATFMVGMLSGDVVRRPEFGFEEGFFAGRTFAGKHGLTNAVVSDLELLPEEHFGVFVSYNSLTGPGAYC